MKKEFGGMGFKQLQAFNLAMLGKAGLEINHNSCQIFFKILSLN